MKKRYTAAMLVAAMLMMNPKLPIRASHAHAEGEEEQANEANSSEQPVAQTKVIWKKNAAHGEAPAETESGEPNASTEDGERPVADGEVTYSSLSMTRQSTRWPWRKRWGKTTSA